MKLIRQQLLDSSGSSRLIIALDGVTLAQASTLANEMTGQVAGIKATDLIDQAGAHALDTFSFPIKFLDPKINDIENTVKNRLKQYRTASIVTVHASMSDGALRAAAQVGSELGIAIVAVTVLTNISEEECVAIFNVTTEEAIRSLTRRARNAGLTGVVCSPHEATLVRSLWPEALIITPGVRSHHVQKLDQVRVATPGEAIKNGADFVVMGRQILTLPSPTERLAEIQSINTEVASVL